MAELEVVTMDEVQRKPSLFRTRMEGETLHFGEGGSVAVRIEALTALQFKHANAVAEQDGEVGLMYWLLRCGIKDINGLVDQDGKAIPFYTQKASIAGRSFDVCADALIDGMHGWMADAVAQSIVALTALDYTDVESLGFTKLSGASVASDAPTELALATSAADTDGKGTPPAA